jgi:hypothetical protein
MSRHWTGLSGIGLAAAIACTCSLPAAAQPTDPGKVEIAWNRYYNTTEIHGFMRRIAEEYPDLVRIETIGKSIQGRDLVVAVVSAPTTGPDTAKPAMWIDGNVHGNEVQAAEVVLYTLWSLTRGYGSNERLRALADNYTFYLMPVVNPDGRDHWFTQPNNMHSSRQNQRPNDNDRDGAVDEDGPDDLDGDGQITSMWKADAAGRWVRSQTDERVFVRLREDQAAETGVATFSFLGDEGSDNDGDGRINEDGPYGDDMNRNWPSDWQPEHIQGGAGPFPLSSPETRAVADFLLAHPNIAAVQSYHNTGGMILRGPGAHYREGLYPGEDVRVYDELARHGEQMLPYYRYLVLFSGLYRVHGGFVNWAAEGVGAFSFTNELWATAKYFQRDNANPNEEQYWLWRDRIAFGELFKPYQEIDHPQYGRVLVGGLNKWSGRITPGFMLEDECHRNFAFTMYHADQMPVLEFGRVETEPVAGAAGLWRIRAEVRNTRLIPTRSELRRRERIGWPDLMECQPMDASAISVVAANRLSDWLDRTPEAVLREPGRLLVESGIPGRQTRVFEFVVQPGPETSVKLRYTSAWAKTIERDVELPPRANP